MEKKLLTALTFTVFSGMAFAATDHSTSGTSSGTSKTADVVPFDKLDTNKDGALSKQEAKEVSFIYDNFDELDFNGDGKFYKPGYYAVLTARAMGDASTLAVPEFVTLDVNQDGQVTETEYRAFKDTLDRIHALVASGKLHSNSASAGSAGELKATGHSQGDDQETSDSQ